MIFFNKVHIQALGLLLTITLPIITWYFSHSLFSLELLFSSQGDWIR